MTSLIKINRLPIETLPKFREPLFENLERLICGKSKENTIFKYISISEKTGIIECTTFYQDCAVDTYIIKSKKVYIPYFRISKNLVVEDMKTLIDMTASFPNYDAVKMYVNINTPWKPAFDLVNVK